MLLARVWTHWLSWFFLANPIFVICLNFHEQNPLKNQYLSHLSSESCEINSIDSLSACQQYQERPLIQMRFSVSILISFHWENGSLINSPRTIPPNNLKSSQCTLLIKSFLKIPRAQLETPWFERSQRNKTKQGVCHTVALPFTLKRILRQKKKNHGNQNISPCKI